MNLAIDAMGGDGGSAVVVQAIKNVHSTHPDIRFTVFGNQDELKDLTSFCTIVHTTQVMSMEEGPLAVRRKSDSSMIKAIEAVKQGQCDGIVSCGSTAALLAASLLILRTFENLERPALTITFPTLKHTLCDMLDVGCNAENSSEQLMQFALMGHAYAKAVHNLEHPKIALLNIGSEAKKGDSVHKDAFEKIKALEHINFVGNIEGRDLLNGDVDVIITDGFSGNIALKTIEGTISAYSSLIKGVFKSSFIANLCALILKTKLVEMKRYFDYRKYGGAILAGINRPVVKAHGSSDVEAFTNAILLLSRLVEIDVVDRMKELL
jgi:glycerol-3-phosphate acyltransferase PlsX